MSAPESTEAAVVDDVDVVPDVAADAETPDVADEDTQPVTDRHGRALPAWVPADHPLAGTALRPIDPAARPGSWLEGWFPVLAMSPAPVALFLIWLRNPGNTATTAAGTVAGLIVVVIALAVAAYRSRT